MPLPQNISDGISMIATLLPLKGLISISNQKLIMPLYHTVSDEHLPHLSNLYKPKSTKEFERDLDYLLMHFEPIDLKQVYALQGKQPQKPSFFLSFDDGLSELKSVVAPILKRKGIPATIFINSAFVDNRELFFRYKVSLLIEGVKSKITRELSKEIANILGILDNSDEDNIIQSLLNLKYHHKSTIDKVANRIEVDFDEYLKKHKPYLSKEHIKDLIADGHSVGAHSVDHPEYRLIEDVDRLDQTLDSIRFVKENFSPRIMSFSFPFTDFQVDRFFFDMLSFSKKCHITFGCAGMKKDEVPRNLQRIAMEGKSQTAKQTIHSEYFQFLLKSMLGKQTIKR